MLSAAASALVCALGVLNRSEASLPPIEIIDTPPPYVSVGTEAYVQRGKIFVIGSAAVVQQAAGKRQGECGDVYAVKKLASILIHEEWHLKHGPDEKGAYERQLVALQQLGIGPGVNVYHDVQQTMLYVLKQRKRNPVTLMAER
jgi:hypothetical protein